MRWSARCGRRCGCDAGDFRETGASGPGEELGDIAIAWDTCAREAAEAGKPLEEHLTHLIVHATLHLLGYDHENDADAELMENLESTILVDMGFPDPYA